MKGGRGGVARVVRFEETWIIVASNGATTRSYMAATTFTT